MKKLLYLFLFATTLTVSAQRPQGQGNPIKITGTVLDKDNDLPLEYATLVLQSVNNPDRITGGITNEKGEFSVETFPGRYNIRVEYISFITYTLDNQQIDSSTDLGTIKLALDVSQLEGVELVGERTTVELRLDKKVYNVGKDLTVGGGSVTDVLDNVPSVSVDVEGNISLRGNESVRILINGKPSALSGLGPDALKQLPADAIEKIEVITNPSARYDAEGTAGILNIVLKQSKTTGLNGSVNTFVGDPENYGVALNLNLRRKNLNIFTNTSYRYSEGPGNAFFKQENFDGNGNTVSFQDEIRNNQRERENFNTNIGFELFIDETSSITNSFGFRKSNGNNITDIDFSNFDANRNPTIERNRYTTQKNNNENVRYSLNYEKRFNDDGHKLIFDYQYSSGTSNDDSIIDEIVLGETTNDYSTEQTLNDERRVNQLLQMDYVLPFGKDNKSQFEFGYRGNFNSNITDYSFIPDDDDPIDNDFNPNNILNYKEQINAAYTQLGTKLDKFNVLAGLRMEASDIEVELVNTNDVSNKNYVNWFPSVFLGYEFSETQQITVSYSRRLRRPWSRFINPFPSRTSNTNLFQGNPDLDPTFTNAFDLGYLKRWDKITVSTSGYYNKSTGVFQFVTQETGEFVEIENPDDPANPVSVPIQVRSPINLSTESRYGMELTTTYSPKRNWRFSWNLNLFQRDLKGDYTYVNFLNEEISQNFDSENFTWFTRISARFPLPAKINFQTNLFYRGPSENSQSKNKGSINTNLALSKDIIKDKATLSLNIRDIFNTRKRVSETRTANVFTESEFQWRKRQITLSFLYRFNQQQNQRGRRGQNQQNGGGGGGGDEDFEFEG